MKCPVASGGFPRVLIATSEVHHYILDSLLYYKVHIMSIKHIIF